MYRNLTQYKRTILITGSTDGIGCQAALELAKDAESNIILHGRCPERCVQALEHIKRQTQTSGENIDWIVGDFSDLEAVVHMSEEIRQRFPKLNVLICNAGVFSKKRVLTKDGLELMFQVNYLAHFVLINCLLDKLKANAPSRIATVSSLSYEWCKELPWDDLQGARPGVFEDKFSQYSATKLAVHLFTFELARQLEGSGVSVNVLEPGIIQTKLLTEAGLTATGSVSDGAISLIFLGQSPAAEGITGKYFNQKAQTIRPAEQSLNEEAQKRLWEVSVQLCKDANVWPN